MFITWESYEPEANIDFRTKYAKTLGQISDQTGMRWRHFGQCMTRSADWKYLGQFTKLLAAVLTMHQHFGQWPQVLISYIVDNIWLQVFLAIYWTMYGSTIGYILDNVWLQVFLCCILHNGRLQVYIGNISDNWWQQVSIGQWLHVEQCKATPTVHSGWHGCK